MSYSSRPSGVLGLLHQRGWGKYPFGEDEQEEVAYIGAEGQREVPAGAGGRVMPVTRCCRLGCARHPLLAGTARRGRPENVENSMRRLLPAYFLSYRVDT